MPVSVANIAANGAIGPFTGNLTQTAIFTAGADMLVELHAYQESDAGFTQMTFSWTDSNGAQSSKPGLFNSNGANFTSLPLFIKSGTSVSVSTTGAGATSTSTVHYTIESLN